MYTTGSGVQIPQGPDAFNPPAQFKDWADGDDVFNNVLNVNLDSERTALTTPKLRDGILCWVRATKTLWSYQAGWTAVWSDSGWSDLPLATLWSSYAPGTFGAVAYRRFGSKGVLRGAPVPASGAGTTIGTLPAGFRPQFDEERLAWMSGTVTKILIQANGLVVVAGTLTGVAITLGELEFTVA